MRPNKLEKSNSGDLFRARFDQIINMRHELVRLADAIDWDWLDGELADRFGDIGRPGTETRLMVGLLLLKHIYARSDEGVCERWVYDPYFRYFTGEETLRAHRSAMSSTPSRMSARDSPTGANSAISWRSCCRRACGWGATPVP